MYVKKIDGGNEADRWIWLWKLKLLLRLIASKVKCMHYFKYTAGGEVKKNTYLSTLATV